MRFFALVLAGFLLSGCGGGGSSSPSPFRGTWVGTTVVRDASGNVYQPTDVMMTVDEKGKVAGTWSETGAFGTLSGSVSREGMLTLVTHYSDGDTLTEQGQTSASAGTWEGTLAVQDPELAGWTMRLSAARQ